MNDFVARLRAWQGYHGQILYEHHIEALQARLSAVSSVLPYSFHSLYSHQTDAMIAALNGQHIVLATPTASGKTLAMALPYLETRKAHPDASLLCLAPTRTLVEQWYQTLTNWSADTSVEWFTHDTPPQDRPRLRKRVQILVTTPDMLHCSVLPYHQHGWGRFLKHLYGVILDECHTCHGVFGSHIAFILRRLQRIVSLYDNHCLFQLASATIGNAARHAANLLGQNVTPIMQNGAPRGEQTIIIWQPPVNRSHSDEAARLMAFFVAQGIQTLLFGQQRQAVERLAWQVRQYLPAHLSTTVAAYRAGFLDNARKEIQHDMYCSKLTGIVSTNVLELGIDIGNLDVVILDGFPGSVASFWQQVGRAGRGTSPSLAILVLRNNALDQYFATHSAHLFATNVEQAIIDPGNPTILLEHLRCAAWERRLTNQELPLFGDQANRAVDALVHQGYLSRINSIYVSQEAESPAYHIPLRDHAQQFDMYTEEGEWLEEIDGRQVTVECYPGAIYLSQGNTYEVIRLDHRERRISLRPCEANYYTKPVGMKVLNLFDSTPQQRCLPHVMLFTGRVRVVEHVTGYCEFHQHSHAKLEEKELNTVLTSDLETQAFWMIIDSWLEQYLTDRGHSIVASLHAVEHTMIALLPLCILCDPRDMGGISFMWHPQMQRPLLCIYDGYQGGIGYAAQIYHQLVRLASVTLEHLKQCPCLSGCPACVQSPRCGSCNDELDKQGAVVLLQKLVEQESNEEEQREK